jgi:hypothetical protein
MPSHSVFAGWINLNEQKWINFGERHSSNGQLYLTQERRWMLIAMGRKERHRGGIVVRRLDRKSQKQTEESFEIELPPMVLRLIPFYSGDRI